jgi:putative acetyltransferase
MSDSNDDVFSLVPSGRFRDRWGPLGPGAAHSDKKLCLVATDLAFLRELLYGLSLRDDCYYVKYGTIEREGMYLGRCFLTTDQAVSELCQELKGHPRLMVSLQDDAGFNAFRDEPVANDSCGVWDDWTEHEAEVAFVLESAFGRLDEAKMVAAVRASRAATISLVAGIPPEARAVSPWPIVGYLLLSQVTIDGNFERRGLGLAPLAVAPVFQGRGFGTRLVEAGLRRARMLGYQYVTVLGLPEFYSRFGFVAASQYGLSCRGISEPAFMALELVPGALRDGVGVVEYHASFSAVSGREPGSQAVL